MFKPKHFHLGMDEETAEHQYNLDYVVLRQYDLWWHDLYFFLDRVQGEGVTAIVYGDRMWGRSEDFIKGMPTTPIIANRYDGQLDPEKLSSYETLAKDTYRQLPAYVGEPNAQNLSMLDEYTKKVIPDDKLLGCILIADAVCVPSRRDEIFAAADAVKNL